MMATFINIFIIHALFTSYGLSEAYKESSGEIRHYNAIDKLHRNLLENYKSNVRPAANHSHHVDVTISMYILHFSMVESDARFEVNGMFRMSWKDDRLSWDPEDYDGVKVIHIESELIWKPDLALYNNIVPVENVHFGSINVLVYSDGSVLHVPPATFQSLCTTNVQYWPFDQQKCELHIGSWTHDGYEIKLSVPKEQRGVNISEVVVTDHWKITDAKVAVVERIYSCCEAPYPVAEFVFTLQRYSPTFHYTVIAPAIMIVFLTLATFLLPTNSSEKLIIGLIDMLILSAYLIYFDFILHGKDHVALIVMFYSNTLVLVGTSIILGIVTIRLSRREKMYGPPAIIQSYLNGVLGKMLCLSNEPIQIKPQEPLEEFNDQSTSDETGREIIQNQWTTLAQALDRLVLIIYVLIFVILMASCL